MIASSLGHDCVLSGVQWSRTLSGLGRSVAWDVQCRDVPCHVISCSVGVRSGVDWSVAPCPVIHYPVVNCPVPLRSLGQHIPWRSVRYDNMICGVQQFVTTWSVAFRGP
jgi:hypothetical protein